MTFVLCPGACMNLHTYRLNTYKHIHTHTHTLYTHNAHTHYTHSSTNNNKDTFNQRCRNEGSERGSDLPKATQVLEPEGEPGNMGVGLVCVCRTHPSSGTPDSVVRHSRGCFSSSRSSAGNSIKSLRGPGSTSGGRLRSTSSKSRGSMTSVRGT